MTASEKSQLTGGSGARLEAPRPPADVWIGDTVRQPSPLREGESDDGEEDGASILGFPAEVEEPVAPVPPGPSVPSGADQAVAGPPVSSALLVYHRRVEGSGGLLLVLAGIAGGVSLALPWVRGDGATGSVLVARGTAVLGAGLGDLLRSTLWQPLAVVFGGYALSLLGLLLFVPARTHRFVGVLAFLAALPAAGGVLVPLADAHWSSAPFGIGMWFAVAVPALGFLGALKAMLSGPRIGMRPQSPPGPPGSGR